jgi:transcriptional/translational regulatory protein YebC/TACO1
VKAVWRPQNSVPVDPEKGATLVKLIGLLEDDDDIQDVYTNTELSEEEMERFGA